VNVRDHLRAFSDLALESADYEAAAEAFNRCRERGIRGSNTDFLICSAALRRGLAICTTDQDFIQYGKVLELELHEPRA